MLRRYRVRVCVSANDSKRGLQWKLNAQAIIKRQTRVLVRASLRRRLACEDGFFGRPCSALILAAAASLTIEGQHSVMSRITKGDWQE